MTKDYGYSVSVIKVFSMADEFLYQELTLKYYCSCLVETLSISNMTRLWLMSPVLGSLGSMVATWIKELTNWFEIAHFRYKIIKLTKLSLKQVCALKECNSQQCRSVKKNNNKKRFILHVHSSHLHIGHGRKCPNVPVRIKEWPTHRPPVTQKINKRLRAVYKTSWTTQPSHSAQTLLDYEWSLF